MPDKMRDIDSVPEPYDSVESFIEEMRDVFGEAISYDQVGDTHEIETDTFVLNFTTDAAVFEIRNIDTRGEKGKGREVVSAIIEYVSNHGLELIASNVKDEARGFWETMGFQEGEEAEQFFWAG